jgi:hypothetical protein
LQKKTENLFKYGSFTPQKPYQIIIARRRKEQTEGNFEIIERRIHVSVVK